MVKDSFSVIFFTLDFFRLLPMRLYVYIYGIHFLMFFNINRTCFSYIKVM